ncbi:hypothetical protein BOX15_Mlig007878g3, partial [Macrostomum lignano]
SRRAQLRAAGTHLLVPSLPGMLAGLLHQPAERDPGLQDAAGISSCRRFLRTRPGLRLQYPAAQASEILKNGAAPGVQPHTCVSVLHPEVPRQIGAVPPGQPDRAAPHPQHGLPVRRRGLPAAQVPRIFAKQSLEFAAEAVSAEIAPDEARCLLLMPSIKHRHLRLDVLMLCDLRTKEVLSEVLLPGDCCCQFAFDPRFSCYRVAATAGTHLLGEPDGAAADATAQPLDAAGHRAGSLLSLLDCRGSWRRLRSAQLTGPGLRPRRLLYSRAATCCWPWPSTTPRPTRAPTMAALVAASTPTTPISDSAAALATFDASRWPASWCCWTPTASPGCAGSPTAAWPVRCTAARPPTAPCCPAAAPGWP